MPKTSKKQKILLVISGLFLCVVLLEAGLRIGGFILSSLQEHRNIISIKKKGTFRIMCLGGSTTAGGENAYPHQLEEVLNQRDIGMKFSVINKGIPGINTTPILAQLEDNLNKYKPDMVITMMGITDFIFDNCMEYEDSLAEKTKIFLESFKTYKLVRLLGHHCLNKNCFSDMKFLLPNQIISPPADQYFTDSFEPGIMPNRITLHKYGIHNTINICN